MYEFAHMNSNIYYFDHTKELTLQICMMTKIDYTKRIPDFRQVPDLVIREELLKRGVRGGNIKKSEMYKLIVFIWQYLKQGEIPFEY